jgi:beta-lactamase regulating signal transducer with metallopeptidase domain
MKLDRKIACDATALAKIKPEERERYDQIIAITFRTTLDSLNRRFRQYI